MINEAAPLIVGMAGGMIGGVIAGLLHVLALRIQFARRRKKAAMEAREWKRSLFP